MTRFLSLLLAAIIFQSATAQKIILKNLKCEYLSNPPGIASAAPGLSWQIISEARNVRQVAYRVLVSGDPGSLSQNKGTAWDSGKVPSGQSVQVTYEGKKLQAAKTYYWKVMVWDNKGNVSSWSNAAKWQMGLLSGEDWKQASWIGFEEMPDSLRLLPKNSERKRKPLSDILPLFRKEFTVSKTVKDATIFIAGLGHFELSINGKKTGDHFLDAGWTNYDKHALYVTFDITSQLKKGANAIGVMLGNGFYFIPGQRYQKLQVAYGYPKLISRILINYTDGTSANIVSDQSWKTAPGPVTFSSIYGGEDYNAGREQQGWDSPSFNDGSWKKAVVVTGPPVLDPQSAEPLKIFDHFDTKKITQPKPGVWVYDMGQNASAIPRIAVQGHKGDTIRLWPSELLDTNGLVTTKPIGTPVYFEYVLSGKGIETWQPRFMYYGFRYVQVTGAVPQGEKNSRDLPVIVSLHSLHTRNAAERVGEFSCSDDLFNKTDKIIDWAIKSNMSSVLTDCPHREKLGWLEEAHLVGPSIRYNFDMAALFRKIVYDMVNAQTPDGLMPDIAPEYAVFGGPFRDSPEWGSNCIIMPWYLYEWYGDSKILEEVYPMMQKYIAYLQGKSKDGILSHGLGDWYDIGPKEPGPSQLTPRGITATAIYYYDLSIMKQVAQMLAKFQDSSTYDSLAAQVKRSYNAAFFNRETKQYGTGSQAANAMSLYMGLVEPEYKDAVLENIIKQIKDNNNSLSAGDIGYRYLLRVLADNGRSDVIYDMNSNAAVPGYGYQLARGVTSLTESWQAFTNASHNHMMLGHLKEWFYSGLAGIKSNIHTVAFRNIIIRPEPVGTIKFAKAEFNSPFGMIVSDWKKDGNNFELTVELPVSTSAVIYLPAEKTSVVMESGKSLDNNPDIKLTGWENGRAIIEAGSGSYHFTVTEGTATSQATIGDLLRMAWWKEAKFGMFIHWGVYSVPAGTYHDKKIPGIGEWIMNLAKIPVTEYKTYANSFNPVKYDPEAWVRMAKEAGMKYIVITSKHHDGFALFDSKVTNWDVVNASPYGKDILQPLVAACRREGIKIGFYYSQAQDWNHPGGVAGGGHWDKMQDGNFDAYLDSIAVPQVQEILTKYGTPDIIWWDTPQDMTAARAEKFLALTRKYPNLIMNNRLGGGFKGDTETPEQYVPATGFPGRNWESCMTMNDTWGYKSYDSNWKSTKTLVRQLADVVSKGGNMLLNVGPTSLGEIPAPSVERLNEIGKWINTNKASIYGTTASPFPYLSWGVCTRKGQQLFLHVFDYPASGVLALPLSNHINYAWLLSDPTKKLAVTTGNGRSLIKLPAHVPDSINTVIVLQFTGDPVVTPPPVAGKQITASSQKGENMSPKNLLDADRQTRWEAAKGEHNAMLEIDLAKPFTISALIADEPWHPWENKKQKFVLQYRLKNEWINVVEGTSAGSGYTRNFKPVTARQFRLLIENKEGEPVLLEWQLYGPE